jgi:hypothetical protein
MRERWCSAQRSSGALHAYALMLLLTLRVDAMRPLDKVLNDITEHALSALPEAQR